MAGTAPNATGQILGALGSGIQQTAQQFGQNTMKGLGYVGQTAQGIGQIPIRIGASLADVPRTIAGQQPLKPFNVAGLGSISTYARQAVDQQNNPQSAFYNKPILSAVNAGSKGVLDASLLGLGAQTALNTPQSPLYNPHQGSGMDVFQEGRRNASGGLNLLDASTKPVAGIAGLGGISDAFGKAKDFLTNLMPAHVEYYQAPKQAALGIRQQAQDETNKMQRAYDRAQVYGSPLSTGSSRGRIKK